MKNTIFVPKKIKVGYQERDDTYTKRLAYVIYYDEKGVLRKETSWKSWCRQNLGENDYENNPISGFVLNKKVGDYSSDWNHRMAYCRVFDPRGFEFEITIENLLYILENASSIKGKGLEGEFVYGWDGKDLILMPVESPDYEAIRGYNDIVQNPESITSKTLIPGAIYLTKKDEQWVYLGRYDKWDIEYDKVENLDSRYSYQRWKEIPRDVNKGPHHFFGNVRGNRFISTKSISGRFVKVVQEVPVENYAFIVEKLFKTTDISPYDKDKDEYIEVTPEYVKERWEKNYYYSYYYINTGSSWESGRIYRYTDGSWKCSLVFENNFRKEFESIEEALTQYKVYRLVKYLKNGNVMRGYYD